MEVLKQAFIQTVVSSLKLSGIIIVLFLLTKPIENKYTAGFRYYSWLAVMIVFLIPFQNMGISYRVKLPDSSMKIQHNVQEIVKRVEQKITAFEAVGDFPEKENESVTDTDDHQTGNTEKSERKSRMPDLTLTAAALWLAGGVFYFALHIKRYIFFRKAVKRLSQPLSDEHIRSILSEEQKRQKQLRELPVRISGIGDTPLLTGLFKPMLVLPNTEYSDEQLRLIFRHELTHYKRKDIWYQFFMLFFLSLHWFNPFAHFMAAAAEIDGETSCDESVLKDEAYQTRIFYGEMLIAFLRAQSQKKSYLTTAFFGGKGAMKKRLNLIASKRVKKNGIAAMVVLLALSTFMSVGAAAMGNGYFGSVFNGETSYLADFVKTDKRSVEDERFKLTLEQYLVTENQAMIIYSFEAKTDDAVKELNSKEFWGMNTIMFGPTDYEKADCHGFGSRGTVGKEINTERKIYGCIVSDAINNKEKIDFYLSTDKIKDQPKIIVPMDYNMETKTLQCGDVEVKYNPISIIVTAPASEAANDCEFCYYRRNNLYFRMKNDEIKTFNQLYENSGGHTNADEYGNDKSYSSMAWAREIIKPDEIKSVIIDDTEYPVDDPSNSKPVTIDEHMKPFIIDAYVKDHLWLPLRAFCDGLGAEIEWDGDTQTASFNYRGSSYSLTVGKTGIVVNGEECDFGTEAPFIDEQGRMIVPSRFNSDNNHCYIAVDAHGYNAFVTDETTGEGSIKPDAKWHIIP